MAFTMHSHSGQFCPGHAVDQLEAIIQHAISIGYKTIGLTEHMPRYWQQDLYPEEVRLFHSHLKLPTILTKRSWTTLPNPFTRLSPATKRTSKKPSACRLPTPRRFTSSSASRPSSSAPSTRRTFSSSTSLPSWTTSSARCTTSTASP